MKCHHHHLVVAGTHYYRSHNTQHTHTNTLKIDELDLLLYIYDQKYVGFSVVSCHLNIAVVHVDHHFLVFDRMRSQFIYIKKIYTDKYKQKRQTQWQRLNRKWANTLLFIRIIHFVDPICLPSLHNIYLTRTDIHINITKLCTNRTHLHIHTHKISFSNLLSPSILPHSFSCLKMNDPRVLIKYWSASLLKYSAICQHEKRAEEYEFMTKILPEQQ